MRWQKRWQGTGAGALMKSNATSEILTRRMKGLSSPIRKRPPRKSREQPYLAGISDLGGRKKYRDLYAKEVASRIEEQAQRFEALESTVKTLNGMAQLAMQQISVLNKELTSLKALPAPSDDGSDSVET